MVKKSGALLAMLFEKIVDVECDHDHCSGILRLCLNNLCLEIVSVSGNVESSCKIRHYSKRYECRINKCRTVIFHLTSVKLEHRRCNAVYSFGSITNSRTQTKNPEPTLPISSSGNLIFWFPNKHFDWMKCKRKVHTARIWGRVTSLKHFLCLRLEFSVAFGSIYSMSSLCDAFCGENRKIRTNRTLGRAEWEVTKSHRKYLPWKSPHLPFISWYNFESFIFLFFLSFSFSHWLFPNLNFIIPTVSSVCAMCMRVRVKTQTCFSSVAFCRKCWFYLHSWHKLDLTFRKCMGQLSGRVFFAIFSLKRFYLLPGGHNLLVSEYFRLNNKNWTNRIDRCRCTVKYQTQVCNGRSLVFAVISFFLSGNVMRELGLEWNIHSHFAATHNEKHALDKMNTTSSPIIIINFVFSEKSRCWHTREKRFHNWCSWFEHINGLFMGTGNRLVVGPGHSKTFIIKIYLFSFNFLTNFIVWIGKSMVRSPTKNSHRLFIHSLQPNAEIEKYQFAEVENKYRMNGVQGWLLSLDGAYGPFREHSHAHRFNFTFNVRNCNSKLTLWNDLFICFNPQFSKALYWPNETTVWSTSVGFVKASNAVHVIR